jgi:hypothetical protein
VLAQLASASGDLASTIACTRWPRSGSGRPITAHDRTRGCALERGLDLRRVHVRAARARSCRCGRSTRIQEAVAVDGSR